MTSERNSLVVNTLASLLFIKLVGTPLVQFKPESYVKSWIKLGHHSADDTNSLAREELNQESEYPGLWKVL